MGGRNSWQFVPVAAAVFAAIFAGALAWYAVTARPGIVLRALSASPQTVRILVAKRGLGQGDVLRVEDLQWAEWPKAVLPDGAFTSVEALLGSDFEDRRCVKDRIDQGLPILARKISAAVAAETSAPTEAPGKIILESYPAGYRAISLRVDNITSAGGHVSPGDRVDIQLNHAPKGQQISSIIVRDIEIIAIDQGIPCNREELRFPQTVIVGVTVSQAQLLSLAQRRGRLLLILRADAPHTQVPLEKPRESPPESRPPPEDFRHGDSRPFPPILRRREVLVVE